VSAYFMALPDFSVLMPVYFREKPRFFREALQSIFDNTVQPQEVVLVCDGPLTLDLEEILQEFVGRPGFKVLRKNRNSGIVDALNMGLAACTTELIVRCDSDDVNTPERFAALIKQLAEGWDIVGSSVREIDTDGKTLWSKRVPLERDSIARRARLRNPINHMSVAFRRDLVLSLGGYPHIFLREDYALWARALRREARVCNLAQDLVLARAGIAMYRRRRGWRSALAEVKLQRLLVQERVSSLPQALVWGGLRFSALLLPGFLLGLLYERILRGDAGRRGEAA
jgi:glycosyltransferase involved in cell wall biosynthesis